MTNPSWQWVLDVTAQTAGTTVEAITGPSRDAWLASARRGMWLFLYNDCAWGLTECGKFTGGRDHTTVRAALKKGEPDPASLPARIAKMLSDERDKMWAESAGAGKAPSKEYDLAPVVYRVQLCDDPVAHYAITPARNGRAMPVSRPKMCDGIRRVLSPFMAEQNTAYLRPSTTPEWLGGMSLTPASEREWHLAAGMREAVSEK